MCDLTGKKTNRRTGYKVLAFIDGQFYSTFTGQRIRVGKVPRPPRMAYRMLSHWNCELDSKPLKSMPFYNPLFAGKTSAFTSKEEVLEFYDDLRNSTNYNNIDIILARIIFNGIVFSGFYQDMGSIIAGDTIKSITVIEQ